MHRAVVTVLLCGLGGCWSEIDSSTSRQSLAGEVTNGENLNGENLNGTGLGAALAWASFENVKLGSVHVDQMWIEGSELVALRRHGKYARTYRGGELAGARLQGRSDTGRQISLRIANVVQPAGTSDVWRYGIEFRQGGSWIPMCLADALTGEGLNGPYLNGEDLNQAIADGDIVSLPAIPLDGYWDYRRGVPGGGDKLRSDDRFTFACPVIGAIGKCVDAGYKPWTLEVEHEACVRLLRADYCGDGTPHTISGTIINLYDVAGVQEDTEDWSLEAEWDQDGARCVTSHLRQAVPVACYDRLYEEDCGDPAGWGSGTVLVSELP